MKIGVIADCFKAPDLFSAFRQAEALQLRGVQLYATSGFFSPSSLTSSDKAKVKEALREAGLEVSALCGDMGGYGFQIAKDNPERIEKTKRIIDLAVEFHTAVVTTHIGVIPADKKEPRYAVMLSALRECGVYAQEHGVTLAIETGPEKAKTLLAFLQDTYGGVGVNLDPANFVMVTGQDPVEAVHLLAPYIVHTHAKDGRMLNQTDPKIVYDHFARGGIDALNVADYFLETPLGEGTVPFPAYLQALAESGSFRYWRIEG